MKTDFRKQIETLIRIKKVSISKLSRMADLNSNTLYKYIRGETQMKADNVAKLLDLLNAIQI